MFFAKLYSIQVYFPNVRMGLVPIRKLDNKKVEENIQTVITKGCGQG